MMHVKIKKYKKNIFLIGITTCVIFASLILFYFYYDSSQYVNAIPPKITSNSPEELAVYIIKYKEKFSGYIKLNYIDNNPNKVKIDFRNDFNDDDSIGAREAEMIAEKKGQSWIITHYKAHWKCLRDFFSDFWTTHSCS